MDHMVTVNVLSIVRKSKENGVTWYHTSKLMTVNRNCLLCVNLWITTYITKYTQSLRVVFSVTRMRYSNSARMNEFDFTTEKIGSVHMTVFEIVAYRNADNWIQLLTRRM